MSLAAPGPDLGPYRVLRTLGTGGMGTVLLAEDTRLGRKVALKAFSGPEAETPFGRRQMMREARAAATLSHPHIAAVHDVLDIDGRVVIVFEYIEGETLSSRIARGPLPVAEALEIARQLADALDAAHARGIVHRDLKPSNVILTREGQAKVLDFGIARSLNRDPKTASHFGTTAPGMLIGTPGYAAPEQWIGQPVDGRSDLYALGVVLFEMITGQRPFSGANAMSLASAVLQGEAPLASSVSAELLPELDGLIASTLARDPAQRPASAREVEITIERLQTRLAGAEVGAPPTKRQTQWTRPLTAASIRRWLPAAVLLVIGVLVGIGTLISRRSAVTVTEVERPPVVAVIAANATGDGSQDYLAAGIAESLIARLAALPSVTVLSRAAVADARARQSDVRAMARELDAAYLVETGVQYAADRLRITLTLVRNDGSVAWGHSVDGSFDSIFMLQTELAERLSEALVSRVSPADRERLAEQPTSSSEALASYYRGRTLLERPDLQGNLDAAVEAFEEAIRLDPRFADAHAALGEACWKQYLESRDVRWAERAREVGLTAMRLRPERPAVRYSVGITLIESGRTDEGIEELQRALALQPNYPEALEQLGRALARQGKIDEAIIRYRQAIELRPNAARGYTEMGLSLYEAGRYKEAADAFERVVALQPDDASAYQRLGVSYQQLGDVPRALTNYQKSLALRPNPSVYSNIGFLHHANGEYAEAIEAYRQALALRPNSALYFRNLGDAYAKMGRPEDATAAYRDAVRRAETDLQVNPRDARNVAALAVYLQKAGDASAARQRAEQALKLAPIDFDVLRRVAAVHALAGRSQSAIDALREALRRGYNARTAATEEDYESLRSIPEFNALVSESAKPGETR